MKKKRLLKTIVPSVLAIAIQGGIAVGTTFALFTSEDNVNIAVTSGTVKASAAITDIKLFSADATLTEGEIVPGGDSLGDYSGTYYYKDMTETGKFLAGGTVDYSAPTMTITNMLPGDKIEAKYVVTNSSNVDVKYRLVAETTSITDESLEFFSALEFTALGQTKTNVKKYATSWSLWTSPENTITTDLKLAMPITMPNKFQDRAAGIKLSVEMVQANAHTQDGTDELLNFQSQEIPANPAKPSGMDNVSMSAGVVPGTANTPLVKIEVPTATENEVKVQLDGGLTNATTADQLQLKVEEKEDSGIVVEAGESVASYDIKLTNQYGQNIVSTNQTIKVSVYVGNNMEIVSVKHDGVTINPKTAGSEEGYVYENGYIVYYTSHFSPFSVVYKNKFDGGSGTKDDPYLVSKASQLTSAKGYTLTYFQLTDDIDFSEEALNESSTYGFAAPVARINNCVIDGDGHAMKMTRDDVDCFFGDMKYSTLKNMTIEANCPIGGYIHGPTLNNVSYVGTKTMYWSNNTGAVGYYLHTKATLTDVSFYMNVVGSMYNGVVFGYNLYQPNITLTNVTYDGFFVSYQAGLIFGNACYGPATITIDNFQNNGLVKHTANDTSKNNIVCGVDGDGQGSKVVVKMDGKTYNYANHEYVTAEGEKLAIGGRGQYMAGTSETGLVIGVNSDNTFNFTASDNEDVAYYEVEIITNVAHVGFGGGSGNISVSETIQAVDGQAVYNTALKKLLFADGEVATSHIGETPIINIDGQDYYMNADKDYVAGVGGRGANVFVRTYDAKGTLLSSGAYAY